MRLLLVLLALTAGFSARAQAFTLAEIAGWQQQARQVTIVRDTWGVPHVSGKTDADAVFGLLYAQCEDDFARVEDNYITAIGRRAEVEGEAALYEDLRARLFMDSTQAISIYQKSPAWMRQLLDAFAAGTNFYLYSHPTVQPRLLRRFRPWMPLMFSEGSIGGNISVVSVERLKAFYSQKKSSSWLHTDFEKQDREPTGSNGFAIAPQRSASGHALLLINPHTSFYFRPEVQMTSAAGLNAYGAVTWGQFFIYQGFNEHCGWMHTSSYADSMDEYLETIEKTKTGFVYRYGKQRRPVQVGKVALAYRKDGQLLRRDFTTYRTHHGPVVGQKDDAHWVTVRMMDTPLEALEQSYLRTKATDYASFREVMKLNGNASNNTVFADSKGTIAYWHGNFMPRRDPRFNWDEPVDGSNPATEWRGLHNVDEIVQVRNPASSFLQNCNATPFTVAGPGSSPDRAKYPAYMAPDAENYRGLNAVRVLTRKKAAFTLDTLIAAAKDPYLTAFDDLLPPLLAAYEAAPAPAPDEAEAVALLRNWNRCYAKASVAQTLAIHWAEKLQQLARPRAAPDQVFSQLSYNAFTLQHTTAQEKRTALAAVLAELTRDFGTWRLPWGEINRYQRLTGRIQETFDDRQPSLPVAFASSAWGSLAAYGSRTYPGTKKRYGNVGNSFIAVVEFGPRVRARSVLTGGVSSHPDSPHFLDQAALYCEENFKEVLFYPEDVRQHAERTYSPGQ
ncbi:Acyl-homoserine lactone (AHL) acylase PvdQ [Hymenobacter daecheongensis DSM 21074]|uniref:Acyl-homoserine lactone (AHL) acylase PvdQ n=1 Tax=Hymenobacter daecheongensis DSM 21074 TaxID=1121955 RepID=A0A1M6GR93_9BACT|nr:penicillin acylase family protein [Hymenobacter daecheongensis]SHJ12449.1 Acyl-homoserine lactone (AHL) acylase PvdQ [Hymenobacter daecheongensis DSM 21074]